MRKKLVIKTLLFIISSLLGESGLVFAQGIHPPSYKAGSSPLPLGVTAGSSPLPGRVIFVPSANVTSPTALTTTSAGINTPPPLPVASHPTSSVPTTISPLTNNQGVVVPSQPVSTVSATLVQSSRIISQAPGIPPTDTSSEAGAITTPVMSPQGDVSASFPSVATPQSPSAILPGEDKVVTAPPQQIHERQSQDFVRTINQVPTTSHTHQVPGGGTRIAY